MLDYRIWGITGLIFFIGAAISTLFIIGTILSWTFMSISYMQKKKNQKKA